MKRTTKATALMLAIAASLLSNNAFGEDLTRWHGTYDVELDRNNPGPEGTMVITPHRRDADIVKATLVIPVDGRQLLFRMEMHQDRLGYFQGVGGDLLGRHKHTAAIFPSFLGTGGADYAGLLYVAPGHHYRYLSHWMNQAQNKLLKMNKRD